MTPKRLTALIPAHNEAYLLAFCLASIRDHFDEIIVLDDASTDGTFDVAADALSRHPRHMIMREEEDALGWIESRNRLCAATDSEWLFFLDADDVLAEYNAHMLREIAEGPEPIVRLQLCELWGDFHHTTGRLRHYDRCHTFVNRAVVKDLSWRGASAPKPGQDAGRKSGSAAMPASASHAGWTAKGGPGPLLFHCKGVKPDRRIVERGAVRNWLRAGRPGRLEDWALLSELSRDAIHAAALHTLLRSRQDRIRDLPVDAPRLPAVIRQAPPRFQMVYANGQIIDRIDFEEDGNARHE